MPEYKYKVRDASGKYKTGTMSASSKAMVKDRLVRMRLMPILIQAVELDNSPIKGPFAKFLKRDKNGDLAISFGTKNPTTKDLVVFTKQFATMLTSGVSLVQALGILAGQQRIKDFGEVLEKVRGAVENGATLSEALEAYPKIFDNLYVAMIRAGEASGNLDTIMMKLVTYIEKAAKIKSQVKSAMMYPLIVLVVAVGVVSLLLVFVVPAFAKTFTDGGKKLPDLTQFVIDMSDWLSANIGYILLIVIVGVMILNAWKATPAGRVRWDGWMIKSPGIGNLLKKIAVGRFCSTMSTMLVSGVNLLDALTICGQSSGNKTIEAFINGVRASVEQGTKLSDPLGKGGLFPQMVVSMVSVGEATGAMDDMLFKISEFYEDEVDLAIKTLLGMIEPIMIVGIGGVVGFIVIAMYLPIFDMANAAGG